MGSDKNIYMDIYQLKNKMEDINNMGYIETHRTGNTGIGKTLEDLLDIEENNRENADLEDLGIEIKSARSQTDSMVTLFTKEPPRSEREFWYRDLIRYAGYTDSKGRQALKCTLRYEDPNNQNLYTSTDDDGIEIRHTGKGLCARYPMEIIENKAIDRIPRLLMVDADTKIEDGKEMFKYTDAVLYKDFSFSSFVDLIENSNCVIDLRMHMKDGGGVRNRGTGWRLKREDYMKELFPDKEVLL